MLITITKYVENYLSEQEVICMMSIVLSMQSLLICLPTYKPTCILTTV